MRPPDDLTVAVTGATGTAGRGLLPLLEADPAVGRVVAVARREWAPVPAGFSKVEYRRADVRDRQALQAAFREADVVVHLAFSLYGVRQGDAELREVNVGGTLNALEAAAAGGARRFVYTSSAAVYGFGRDRPATVDEEAPVDPEPRHFYSRHKAEAERLLMQRLQEIPAMEWVFLRPCAIVGPHALGAAAHFVPRRLRSSVASLAAILGAAGLRPPVPAPPVPLQFVHESDVGQALHRAVSRDVPSGIYNLAGDGIVDGAEVPRIAGFRRLPVPRAAVRAAVELGARSPYPLPAVGWLQLLTRQLVLDTTRARRELGWEPEFTSRDALAATRPAPAA